MDTLATALYVRTDDLLKQYPDLAPWRPKIGLQPQLTDAELVTLAVMQALLGYTSEARWIRIDACGGTSPRGPSRTSGRSARRPRHPARPHRDRNRTRPGHG
jgi:hypothetical protein